ncbi:MAG: hypothetical protein QM653_15515 [Dysgonomonas sp.]|uniref:hypothetical protein n=1 Tax=Dysgonomonas TaxID=156973 RepID=UPI00334079A5
MITIKVYTIDKVGGIFTLCKSIDVAHVPNIGEKIVITDNSYNTFVYEVVDIHFTDESKVDLYTRNRGDHTSYTVDLSDEIEDLNE